MLHDGCDLPARFGIGNHDVFGWGRKRTRATEPGYGKRMAMDQLGLASTYYSFDQGGWHFVVLDSIQPRGEGYVGRIDEPQFAWLADDLARVGRHVPVVVQTHIPIFSVTPLVPPQPAGEREATVPITDMHADYARLRYLFREHPNVKLALSSHTHLVDRVDSACVTYVCDGAVCGNWWKGVRPGECDCGYGIVDLYDDGTFAHQYVTYGWTPVATGGTNQT